MSMQEDIHAIRQGLESLVRHLAGSERSGESNHRNGQCDSSVSRTKYCVRSEQAPCVWGPFNNEKEAWIFIHEIINKNYTYSWLKGSEEEKYATFQEIGTYIIEDFHSVNQKEKEKEN